MNARELRRTTCDGVQAGVNGESLNHYIHCVQYRDYGNPASGIGNERSWLDKDAMITIYLYATKSKGLGDNHLLGVKGRTDIDLIAGIGGSDGGANGGIARVGAAGGGGSASDEYDAGACASP